MKKIKIHPILIKIKLNFFLFILYHLFLELVFNVSLLKPKVSVFLPIYNKESDISRSINSIQKQTLKDIEIIAVNDFSTDNTLKILKKLVKKDKRIKIVNNDRNHGLLYSRAMGILNCSGEFVLNLDPDDMLSDEKNLKILYSLSKAYRLDIITFLLKKIKVKNIVFLKEQIKELNKNNYKSNAKNQRFEGPVITNKFINKNIILKSYNYFKKKIINGIFMKIIYGIL